MLYVSGHGPAKLGDPAPLLGKVGAKLTLEQGKESARLVGINILATVKNTLGSLDRVKRLVKTLGMVNATPDFLDHPLVINGFSELMAQVFGDDAGVGSRSAVGMGRCRAISRWRSSAFSRWGERPSPRASLRAPGVPLATPRARRLALGLEEPTPPPRAADRSRARRALRARRHGRRSPRRRAIEPAGAAAHRRGPRARRRAARAVRCRSWRR